MKPIGISFSHKLLLIVGMTFLLDIISKGTHIVPLLQLSSDAVLHHYDIWRLFTYPFAGQSVGELLVFMSVMFFAGDKVETVFPRFKFPLLLTMLTVLQALGFMLFLPSDPNPLNGTTLISFFTLGMYVALFPRHIAEVFVGYRIPVPVFATLLAIIGLIFSGAYLLTSESFLFYRQFSQSIIGGCLGIALSWSNKRSSVKKQSIIQSTTLPVIAPPPDEELEPVSITGTISSKTPSMFTEFREEDFTDEEQLNLILDRMIEVGYDALTESERHFLDQYSQNLQK
ncbi:MAG: rhomboid family intramembrane serine protease [Candidatus Kapaibacterium sp.]|jgi:membrane associated rhomboid family serine protease